jgi:flagellar biosynthesis chaperone FliJ
MRGDSNSEAIIEQLRNQIRQLEITVHQWKGKFDQQSESYHNLQERYENLNLLKILSTTGILRDLELGKDPEVQSALKLLLLKSFSTELEGWG